MESSKMTCLLTPIVGKKVIIRSMSEGDLEQLYALETDEAVKRYVGGPVKKQRDGSLACVRASVNRTNHFV